ncbi:unnamed protein product [Nezara viridula]|uniref:Uncharacterized protein n=1 Tax=Nezara viridula TaxID=85310 RepID=A0A9P0MUW6_NEZVI|nr:unnamed protein product [Nezara viridula]
MEADVGSGGGRKRKVGGLGRTLWQAARAPLIAPAPAQAASSQVLHIRTIVVPLGAQWPEEHYKFPIDCSRRTMPRTTSADHPSLEQKRNGNVARTCGLGYRLLHRHFIGSCMGVWGGCIPPWKAMSSSSQRHGDQR